MRWVRAFPGRPSVLSKGRPVQSLASERAPLIRADAQLRSFKP
jgi:hypothetical protein